MNRESSSEHHFTNKEQVKAGQFFRQEAEKLIAIAPEDSVEERARLVNTAAHLLEQAFRYHFHVQEANGELMVNPNTTKSPEWQNVLATWGKIAKVNNLPWQKVDEGQHYQAVRPDGSRVTAPARFFSKDKHIILNNVSVNREGGYTINDALQAIIGKEQATDKADKDHVQDK